MSYRTLSKFKVLELVARVPYQAWEQAAYIAITHVHERTGMARRIYGQFVYGLSQIGKMQVFTSSGAGTWGPPLRLGSNPEIVMLELE